MKPLEPEPRRDRYPVCKDCGEEFEYDFCDPNEGSGLCLACFLDRREWAKEEKP